MTVAASLILVVTLILLGGVALLRHIGSKAVGKAEINVWLKDQITPSQNSELIDAIRAMPEVANVVYASKDQAYEKYQEMFAGSPSLVAHVSPLALPASLRITPKNPKTAGAVRRQIRSRPGVTGVHATVDATLRLLRADVRLCTVGLIMSIFLLAGALMRPADAWFFAGLGVLNAVLIYRLGRAVRGLLAARRGTADT